MTQFVFAVCDKNLFTVSSTIVPVEVIKNVRIQIQNRGIFGEGEVVTRYRMDDTLSIGDSKKQITNTDERFLLHILERESGGMMNIAAILFLLNLNSRADELVCTGMAIFPYNV